MSYDTARPYLAVFVIIRKQNKIACLLRSGTDWMNGYYGLPAGKVEYGERATTGAVREALEEIGVTIKESDLKLMHVAHRKAIDDTDSWIDLIFETEQWDGEPRNAEPKKHSELAWLDPSDLPENVLPVLAHVFKQMENGKTYSEFEWNN